MITEVTGGHDQCVSYHHVGAIYWRTMLRGQTLKQKENLTLKLQRVALCGDQQFTRLVRTARARGMVRLNSLFSVFHLCLTFGCPGENRCCAWFGRANWRGRRCATYNGNV